MKYRGVRSLPNSVSTWLEHKLEDQGIDSSVYSRYVISLLQHDSVEVANLPDLLKSGRNTKEYSWQNLDTEELRRSVAVDYLSASTDQQTSGIESLVDELCAKLKEVDSEGTNCLKEKTTNSRLFYSSPVEISQNSAINYYSPFPTTVNKTNATLTEVTYHTWFKSPPPLTTLPFLLSSSSPLSTRKKEIFSEITPKDSNKICKRKDGNKENIRLRGRMRSRSTTAKQQIQSRCVIRASAAKSLDRKDEDGTGKSKVAKHFSYFSEGKGRKCLSFKEEDPLVTTSFSRTPAPRNSEKFEDLSGCDKDLPMDFQQLLQSPEDDRVLRRNSGKRRALHLGGNFIQCGTNITSSIWSAAEKMDVDCSSAPGSQETASIPSWDCPERSQKRFSTWKGLPFYFTNTGGNAEEYTVWSDVESTTLALEGNDDSAQKTFFSSLQSTEANSSYNGLNHDKDSSFTEVKPNKPPQAVESKAQQEQPNESTTASQPPPQETQEEDLLTSMKTHFRPIRQESYDKSAVAAGAVYSDGTTFHVSTSLEEVKFDRSESGALYLGCCKDLKYMEYKEAVISGADFVPKFRVKQNEKFCQTEEDTENVGREEDNYEFYFPGDERLAEDMVNRLVDDDDDDDDDDDGNGSNDDGPQDQNCAGLAGSGSAVGTASIRVDGWVTAWPIGEPTSAIWSNTTAKKTSSGIIDKFWVSDDRNWSKGGDCNDKGGGDTGLTGSDDHYLQLRHELTQEGEELLSDLSSIHLFLDPDAPTTPPTQAYYPKRMRIRPCPFRSETDSLL